MDQISPSRALHCIGYEYEPQFTELCEPPLLQQCGWYDMALHFWLTCWLVHPEGAAGGGGAPAAGGGCFAGGAGAFGMLVGTIGFGGSWPLTGGEWAGGAGAGGAGAGGAGAFEEVSSSYYISDVLSLLTGGDCAGGAGAGGAGALKSVSIR